MDNNPLVKTPGTSATEDSIREIFTHYGALIMLALLILFNLFFTRNFLQASTFYLLIRQTTTILFMTIGMTVVISSGGIDISTGAVMALGGTVLSLGLMRDGNFALWAVVAVVICTLVGMFSGFLIAKVGVQAIILTLIMQISIRGIVLLSTESSVQYLDRYSILRVIGTSNIFWGIPIQMVYFTLLTAVALFAMHKTTFGKQVEAIGGNARAARLSGVRDVKLIVIVYTISALLACFSGILETARGMCLDPNNIGLTKEMDAIAAVAIGGTSMRGGRANMLGAILGCVLITLITMTVNMNGLPASLARLFKALIIIFSLVIQREKRT